MPIDKNQMLNIFIEETIELLQSMESALLEIEIDNPDPEKINLMFRVMHSTKSGAAIVGYNPLSHFCHALESLLQHIRDGVHKLSQFDVNLLFNSIDLLRTSVEDIKNNRAINENSFQPLLTKISESIHEESDLHSEIKTPLVFHEEKIIESSPSSQTIKPKEKSVVNEDKKIHGWQIHFHPGQNLLELRNNPYRVFQCLNTLGQCKIQVDASDLPELEELNPQRCYLSWDIQLQSQITLEELKDLFAWITEEHLLSIKPIEESEKEITPKLTDTSEFTEPSATSAIRPISEISSSIRVSTEKIDYLMNVIGELVITQSMLSELIENYTKEQGTPLYEGFSLLERNLRDVQEIAMRMRMVPIYFIFNRYPRMIHDLSLKMKKQVHLIISGENTEIDKLVMEKIGDPLLHLIRNAVDHGIELPHVREKVGKPPVGTISLNAYQEGGEIVIDIIDDGCGLNKGKIRKTAIEKGLLIETTSLPDDQLYSFIFQPGFSTASKITEISGRGVGLDIVYRNILDAGGSIELQSTPNEGSLFRLRLPLTLAIMDSQLIRVCDQTFIVPLLSISELLKIESDFIHRLDNAMTFYNLRGENIPLIYLSELFNLQQKEPVESDLNENQKIDRLKSKSQFLIIVDINNTLYGLVCDEFLAQKQIVIKNIENNYQKIKGISGATILGNGNIYPFNLKVLVLSSENYH